MAIFYINCKCGESHKVVTGEKYKCKKVKKIFYSWFNQKTCRYEIVEEPFYD